MSEDPVQCIGPNVKWKHTVEVLERKRVIAAILYLYDNGPTKEILLCEEVFPNPQQTASQLQAMKDMGIVMFERDIVVGTRRMAKFWRLTERGRAIANLLQVMELATDGTLTPIDVITECDRIKACSVRGQ